MKHFTEACMRTIFNVPAGALNSDDGVEFDDDAVAYHEAGHVVIDEVLCPGCVTLTSVYGRRGSPGGFTSICPPSDVRRYDWNIIDVIASLGGMASAEQKLGFAGAGASKDLERAFDIIANLISSECICGFGFHSVDFNDSQDMKARREYAAAMEIEKHFRRAKEILAQNDEFLEKVYRELKQKKILHTADIQRIKAECNIISVTI